MAYPVVLDGRTYTLADFEGLNYVDGFPDALESFVTHAANVYTSTSTSSVEIGTGSKTFTIADTGKPYLAGTPLRIAATSDPIKSIYGWGGHILCGIEFDDRCEEHHRLWNLCVVECYYRWRDRIVQFASYYRIERRVKHPRRRDGYDG